MIQDVYQHALDLGFSEDQYRIIERRLISYHKMMSIPPPAELQFVKACERIIGMIKFKELRFGTALDLDLPDRISDSGGNSGKSNGPGFESTQMDYNGIGNTFTNRTFKKAE